MKSDMTLEEFIEMLKKDAERFSDFYQDGMDGPDRFDETMDEVDWYEHFQMWLASAESAKEEEPG